MQDAGARRAEFAGTLTCVVLGRQEPREHLPGLPSTFQRSLTLRLPGVAVIMHSGPNPWGTVSILPSRWGAGQRWERTLGIRPPLPRLSWRAGGDSMRLGLSGLPGLLVGRPVAVSLALEFQSQLHSGQSSLDLPRPYAYAKRPCAAAWPGRLSARRACDPPQRPSRLHLCTGPLGVAECSWQSVFRRKCLR